MELLHQSGKKRELYSLLKDMKTAICKRELWVMLLFSVIVYFPLISQRLTNSNDGLWTYSLYRANRWEMSIGRWLWPYWDALHLGIQLDPLNSLMALFFFSIGWMLIMDLFLPAHRKIGCLAGMCFIASACIGMSLSYRFMSPVFGLAFLFSVTAVYSIAKSGKAGGGIVRGAFCLTLSLGLYQAYLNCFALLILAYFLKIVSDKRPSSDISRYIWTAIGSAVLGVAAYWLAMQVHLKVFHIQLASYMGASGVSLLNTLKNLPAQILRIYSSFFDYFFGSTALHNIFQRFKPFFGLLLGGIFVGFAFLFRKIARGKQPLWTIFSGLAILLLPLGCSLVLLAVPDANYGLQMTAGLALFLPLSVLLIDGTLLAAQPETEQKTAKVRLSRGLLVLAAASIVYGNVYMMAIDQEAMHEGRQATTTISHQIISALDDIGYFENPEEKCVMLVGRPSASPIFRVGEMYERANGYAKYGRFFTKQNCIRMSWSAVFRDLTPSPINFCSEEMYLSLIETEEIAEMPLFPQKGSIQEINGILVVKISDEYANVVE